MKERSVLLVEDDPLGRKAMRVALQLEGLKVIEAASGHEALELMSARPDLVVQDLRLPDTDGLELAEKLRSVHQAPIIAVSGVAASLQEARELDEAFARFLVKPVPPDTLVAAVHACMPAPEPEHDQQAQTPQPEPRRVLLVLDETLKSRHLMLHLHKAGFHVTVVSNPDRVPTIARQTVPHAIVCDVSKVSQDEYQLLKKLKNDPKVGATPRLLISPFSSEEAALRQAWSGLATEVVRYDRNAGELIEALRRFEEPMAVRPTMSSTAQMSQADYMGRLEQELEHQAKRNTTLARTCALQATQLSVLAGVAEVLTRSPRVESLLEEVLARYMDIEPFTHGAAYLMVSGRLRLVMQHGFDRNDLRSLGVFWEEGQIVSAAMKRGLSLSLPSTLVSPDRSKALLEKAGLSSMFIMPLVTAEQRLGALMLGSSKGDVRQVGMASAHLIQGQVSQAIALGRMLARLAASEQRFRNIADFAAEGLVVTDEAGRITYLNPTAAHMFQLTAPAMMGQPLAHYVPGGVRDKGTIETQALRGDRSRMWLRVSTSGFVLPSGEGQHTHILLDVTERKQYEDQLLKEARHDPLTGLLNRTAFEAAFSRFLEDRPEAPFSALVHLDLDGFKALNDTYGHQLGDEFLAETGELIKKAMHPQDFAARYAGDSFGIVLTRPLRGQIDAIVRRLSSEVGSFELRPGRSAGLGASIGVVYLPQQAPQAPTLMARADNLIKGIKAEGGHQTMFSTI